MSTEAGEVQLSARRQPLSNDEIDQLAEPLGVALPPELRVWWRWFNGATEPRRVELTPILEVVALEVALRGRETLMGVAAEVCDTPGEADELFPSSFLPVFGTGGSVNIAANASVGRQLPCITWSFTRATTTYGCWRRPWATQCIAG